MNFYRLGAVNWAETQAFYHALAHMGEEALVFCQPDSRCVCLGLHDDLDQEVRCEYCRSEGIPLIRRDIGGGMVLLDRGQVFFQLILRADNALLTGRREDFFTRFLTPAVKTLDDFGIAASIRKPADIVVGGRKISGNGAGDIHGFAVYTGNILVDFDRETMAQVFRVPNEQFRDRVRLSLTRYVTTMTEELGLRPAEDAVEERLAFHFSQWLGELTPSSRSETLRQAVAASMRHLTSPDFLSLPGKKSAIRRVKIREGTYVQAHSLPEAKECAGRCRLSGTGGRGCLGHAVLVIQDGMIAEASWLEMPCLTGGRGRQLAEMLRGLSWNEAGAGAALAEWYSRQDRPGWPAEPVLRRGVLGKH